MESLADCTYYVRPNYRIQNRESVNTQKPLESKNLSPQILEIIELEPIQEYRDFSILAGAMAALRSEEFAHQNQNAIKLGLLERLRQGLDPVSSMTIIYMIMLIGLGRK